MIIENLSTRKERVLKSQELGEVIGGLPTDTVPLAITGGIIAGGTSIYKQFSDNGSVDFNTFLRDTNAGVGAGIVTSLLTPT